MSIPDRDHQQQQQPVTGLTVTVHHVPSGARRRLPSTPCDASGSAWMRRSSSPRFLPSVPLASSPDYLSENYSLHKRRSSGRLLPNAPPPSPQPPLDAIANNGECNEWPRPTPVERKFSDFPQSMSTEMRNLSMSPAEPSRRTSLSQQSSLSCQPGTSLDHSIGTPNSTNAHSQSSSTSTDQLTSSDVEDPSAHGINVSLYKSGTASSSNSAHEIAHSPAMVPTSSSWPEAEPRPLGLGLVHCTIQHFPVRKRLRVSILKAEGLAGKLRPELEIHAVCKVSLVPGGGKVQHSIARRGRDVVYNQEFFFDNISVNDLNEKCLSVTVCHQSPQKLQKDIVIGDLYLPLRDLVELHSKKEVKVVEELKHRINAKKLGKIHITTCIEKNARRLTINIVKVEDLPKGGITGPPDVCVRISLTQGDKSQTKQSRVIKSTCNAVYKEAIMFLVDNTKMADLQQTNVSITVHDLLRTSTGDDLIGSVFLGRLGVEKSEMEQWKNTIERQGKEFKGAHHLKPPQRTPDVHVAEAPNDQD